jgi:hypothetical protein
MSMSGPETAAITARYRAFAAEARGRSPWYVLGEPPDLAALAVTGGGNLRVRLRPGRRRILARLRVRPGRLADVAAGPAAAEVQDHRDRQRHHDDARDGVGGTVEVIRDVLPVSAQGVARDAEGRRPGDAAERGEQAEPARGHVREPGGQRDEGAHHGHHAAEQHRGRAVPVEPGDGAVDIVAAHSEPASPAPDRGLTGVPAHAPGEVAPGHVAEHPGEHDAGQREMHSGVGAGGERAAEQHDDFGRDRDTGRLGQHQQEHRDVPVLDDQVLHKAVPSSGYLLHNCSR